MLIKSIIFVLRCSLQGYWGLPELSAQDFNGVLTLTAAGDNSSTIVGEFLRTGDLGFLHAGELFVCGRVKDLIIVRGRNHYPRDIERTCEELPFSFPSPGTSSTASSTPPLRGGCSACFSVPMAGQEQLVYVAELSDAAFLAHSSSSSSGGRNSQSSLSLLMESLRLEISRVHGVGPAAILLLQPR